MCSIVINSKAQQSTNNDRSGQIAKEMATRSSNLDMDNTHVYTTKDFHKPSTQGPVSDTEIMQTSGSPTLSDNNFPHHVRTLYETKVALVKAALNALKSLAVDPHTKAEDGIRKYEEDMSRHIWSSDAVISQRNKTLVAIFDNETKRAIEPYRATLEEVKQETLAEARQSIDRMQREIDKQVLELDEYARDLLSKAENRLASLAARMGEGGSLDELRKNVAASCKAGREIEGGSRRIQIVILSEQIRQEMAYIMNQQTLLNNEYTITVLEQVVKKVSMNVVALCLSSFT